MMPPTMYEIEFIISHYNKKIEPFMFYNRFILEEYYNEYYDQYNPDQDMYIYLRKRFNLYYNIIFEIFIIRNKRHDYYEKYFPLFNRVNVKDPEESLSHNDFIEVYNKLKKEKIEDDSQNKKFYKKEEILFRAYNLLCKLRNLKLIKRKDLKLKDKKIINCLDHCKTEEEKRDRCNEFITHYNKASKDNKNINKNINENKDDR